jgi:hypothetical protein
MLMGISEREVSGDDRQEDKEAHSKVADHSSRAALHVALRRAEWRNSAAMLGQTGEVVPCSASGVAGCLHIPVLAHPLLLPRLV